MVAEHRSMVAEQGCQAPDMVAEQSCELRQSTMVHTWADQPTLLPRLEQRPQCFPWSSVNTALATRSRRGTLDLEHNVLRERCEKHGSARVLSAWKTRLEQLTGSHTSNGKDRFIK